MAAFNLLYSQSTISHFTIYHPAHAQCNLLDLTDTGTAVTLSEVCCVDIQYCYQSQRYTMPRYFHMSIVKLKLNQFS